MNLGILGAGSWGTVLALLASKANARKSKKPFKVYLFDRNASRVEELRNTKINKRYLPNLKLPEDIFFSSSLEEIFSSCNLIVPVVPAKAMRSFVRTFASFAQGDHFIVHGTKGFEPGTLKRMSTVIQEETGCLRIGALSGPNLAHELAQGLPGATTIASRFDEVRHGVAHCFSSEHFFIEHSKDILGVELIGAFKNIIALCSGFASSLEIGKNASGMLMTWALKELLVLMENYGARPETILNLAGIGDILATSTSPLSRNFQGGVLLGRGKSGAEIEKELTSTVEGLNTLDAVHHEMTRLHIQAPILQCLFEVSSSLQTPQKAMETMLSKQL